MFYGGYEITEPLKNIGHGVEMLSQEAERQMLANFLRQLSGLEQKVAGNYVIGLLPVWILQREQPAPLNLNQGQQRAQPRVVKFPWEQPRSLDEMAEEFALSPRCGSLIYEIFSLRPRMAYTRAFGLPQSINPLRADDSTDELDRWLHSFMDDGIAKWE